MSKERMVEMLLDALALAWLNDSFEVFKNVDEYMDCVRQVKERFND
jgi:hypothetical protein